MHNAKSMTIRNPSLFHQAPSLRLFLDTLYRQCDIHACISGDPLEFPHRYTELQDIEAAGLISAVLAYGRVDLFKAVIDRVLLRMGQSPAAFLADFSLKHHAKLFSGIYYRFNTTDDILLYALHRVMKKHGSIEKAFCRHMRPDASTVEDALTGFVAEVRATVKAKDSLSRGFSQLFPSPLNGSACKRLNLYLRWMVRQAAPDFGIWRNMRADQLVIPLDLHIGRIGRCFGLTTRKSDDWKTAVEITVALKRFDPKDPLKYDFPLCHLGITRECHADKCGSCRMPAFRKSGHEKIRKQISGFLPAS